MENKMEMKELNLNEMSGAAGGSKYRMTKPNKGVWQGLHDLAANIYKKLFAPTETLE